MFKVYLLNGQNIYEGKCKWLNLPKIPIVKLEYYFPNKKILVMQGFQSYLQIKEYYKFFYGAYGEKLDTINVLGKYKDNVYQFSMNISKNKAFQRKNKWGKEFASLKINPKTNKIEFGIPQKTNSSLWHSGVCMSQPSAEIKSL